jgi:hypothetical protein
MQCFFFKFTSASVLLFWKMFLLDISETVQCSVSVLLVKIAFMLDVLQLLRLFVSSSMYLESKLCLLMILYNPYFLITNTLSVLIINLHFLIASWSTAVFE